MATEMKYRTFDSLLADVRVDFKNININGMIEPQQQIKVAKRVNRDLGIRIFMPKQAVIEIEHNKGRLPDDFYSLNFALMCGEHIVTIIPPQGTHVEDLPLIPRYRCTPKTVDVCAEPVVGTSCNRCYLTPCCCITLPIPCTQVNACGDQFEVCQIINTEVRHYKYTFPLKIKTGAAVNADCPNVNLMCADEASIQDNFLNTSFRHGKVYINYRGMMEDEDGNLLVPDDEILNEYYEYAVKERILENLYIDGEDVAQKLGYIQQKLKEARKPALSLVNTPSFAEMRKVHDMNRKAQYSKYYDLFSSYPTHRRI